MLKKYFAFLFSLFTVAALVAQDTKPVKTDLQDYQYRHEASGGLRIQTNGISVFGEYGWIRNIRRTRSVQVEYDYYIDYRQKSQKPASGRNYVFGVQNRFHTIRFDYGLKRVIADKADKNGVKLSFVYFGGISLGLLKPYYLDLVYHEKGIPVVKAEKYSSANSTYFLSNDSINDAAPIRKGLNQIQPVIGLNSKLGLDFDWGKKDAFVKALQAGVMLDIYYKRLPIMIATNNRFYQFTFYLSFQIGKRY